jgi:hypothetical protein
VAPGVAASLLEGLDVSAPRGATLNINLELKPNGRCRTCVGVPLGPSSSGMRIHLPVASVLADGEDEHPRCTFT